MNLNDLNQLQNIPLFNSPYLPLLMVWSLFWKGLALWRSAAKGERVWFVFLFIVNTLGILDIIYLLLTRREKQKSPIIG